MYLTDRYPKINTATPAITMKSRVQVLSEPKRTGAERFVPEPGLKRTPCIPLTAAQLNDYLSLISRVDELRSDDRHAEAGRTYQIAKDILRTGAPSLE